MDMAQSVNALSESGTNAEITDIRQILEREGFRLGIVCRKTEGNMKSRHAAP